jgi:site-specific recombinase XerD
MTTIKWNRYPLIAECTNSNTWLKSQADLKLAQNTIDAYGRALEDFFRVCARLVLSPERARREHVAAYVQDLSQRQNARATQHQTPVGLANATLQQRLTAVRLFFDHLVEEGIRPDNPVGRGRYVAGKGFGGARARGLIPRYRKLPWIPNDEEWRTILVAARDEPLRNRLMLALAYDAALRREELCSLLTSDIDPSQRLLRIRAEVTKSRCERVVPYLPETGKLLSCYLRHRKSLSRHGGALFLSESRRNHSQPLSIWSWSKIIRRLAERAKLSRLTTHSTRHLCLTDLARAGWDIHEIARFAGHRSIQTTLNYIHLSGRELAAKLEASMSSIHAWRVRMITEVEQ